jgi:LPXTG-motif cell wall-anchored protein
LALNSTPRRRTGVALGVVLTGVAAGLIGFAGTASAHTPKISAECKEATSITTLNVKLSAYNGSKANTIKITDGSTVLHEGDFRENFQKKFEAPGDVKHSFTVTVKAWDDPRAEKGWSFESKRNVEACVTPPPSSSSSSSSSTPPSSTSESTPPSSETTSSTPSSSTTPPPVVTTTVSTSSTPPAPTTTVLPTTTTPPNVEEAALAQTGASIGLPLGIAGVLIVGGVVLLFVMRRRNKA